jgi:hypothetical protein
MNHPHWGGSSEFGFLSALVVDAVAFLALFPSFLPTFLLGVALVFADNPFFLSGVLANVASILTPLHALGFGKHLI